MECLEHFDQRLATAVKTLQELGKWDTLVQSGGSSSHTLAMSSSGPDKQVSFCTAAKSVLQLQRKILCMKCGARHTHLAR